MQPANQSPPIKSRTPDCYAHAELRCVLPHDDANGRIAMGFDRHDGGIVRISINEESAIQLTQLLSGFLINARSSVKKGGPACPG
jgi:hypothetical protein